MPKAAIKTSNKTIIDCPAAGVTAVFVAGSFNDWNPQATPMERRDDGIWRAELDLAPGRYEYKFVVDGVWCCDPGRPDTQEREGCVPNVFGTTNRVLDVPETRA